MTDIAQLYQDIARDSNKKFYKKSFPLHLESEFDMKDMKKETSIK